MSTSLLSSPHRGAFGVLLFFACAGCGASARFYSKNGASYPRIADRAVICSEQEAEVVARLGGENIGSIDGKGLAANATEDDVVEKAAIVAGKKGGTHIVLTDRGEDTFVYEHPATKERVCTWQEGVEVCDWAYTPASTTTRTEPTARFLVFRVPPEKWASLPPALRPAAAD